MAHWETLPFLVVSVSLAGLALLAIVSNPRSAPHRALAVFLILVALNFGADWVAKAFAPTDLTLANPAYRLAAILNPFDAAALLYFASVYPKRVGVAKHSWAAAALLGALALYAIGTAILPIYTGPAFHALRVAPFAFFAGCYLGALYLTGRSLVTAEFPATRDAMRPIFAGLLVAVAPRLGLLDEDFRLKGQIGMESALAIRFAITVAVLVVAVMLVWRAQAPDERARTRPWLLAAGAFTGAVALLWGAGYLIQSASPSVVPFYYTFLYTARWLFFAVVVAHAMTRHAFLDMDRRIVASLRSPSTLVAFGVAFAALYALLSRAPAHEPFAALTPLLLATGGGLLAAVAAGASRGLRASLGDPGDAALRARKHAAYRGLVEAELEAGERVDESRVLSEHRARLGLTLDEHRDLVALALAERALRDARSPAGSLPQGYELERVFPSSATTWTVLARRARDREIVVVKVLRPEWRANEKVMRAFVLEASALRRVLHPNVLRVLDVVESPPALVVEHMEGGSLAQRVRERGPLQPHDLARLANDLLAGLAALHDAGLVHRDVKPENVLLDREGRAVVADLGASRPMPTGETRVRVTSPGEEAGTVLYMAPEQVRGLTTDARTDLYAAAATLVFAATGRHYLSAEDLGEYEVKRRIVESPVVTPPQLGPLGPVVRACLEKDPGARPPDARAALAELAPATSG